jgi:hypothetical protein
MHLQLSREQTKLPVLTVNACEEFRGSFLQGFSSFQAADETCSTAGPLVFEVQIGHWLLANVMMPAHTSTLFKHIYK